MINIVDMQKSFVLAWVTKLTQPGYEKWKAFPQYIFSQLGKRLYCFKSNASSKIFLGSERIKSYFWKQLLMLWSILRPTKEKDKEYTDPFKNECLWNNGYVMYKGKRLFILDWINANLLYIRDLWYDGDIVPLCEIEDKEGHSPSRLSEYKVIRTAVRARATRLGIGPSLTPTHQTSRNAYRHALFANGWQLLRRASHTQ